MNRRAALAFFAVSLTLLPACVTVVQSPPASEPSATEFTALTPNSLPANKPSTTYESDLALLQRQREALRASFLYDLRWDFFQGQETTKAQEDFFWMYAQDACRNFDNGVGLSEFLGFKDSQVLTDSEDAQAALTVFIIRKVCPNHVRLLDEPAPS
jgi:outer membrane biogenesis lipoprotein LolB